jgi:hypothetical protein
MPNRRELAAGGVSAAVIGLAGNAGMAAAPVRSRIETRLFNLNDSLSAAKTSEIIETFKRGARNSGAGGFLIGRNLIQAKFPTRFEWIYMAGFTDSDPTEAASAYKDFARKRDELAVHCRDQAVSNLDTALPPGFADAAGVKVRHTVMFNFKPDASPAARDRNVAAIRRMGKLPMVQNYVVERASPLGTGPDQMEWQVIGDFASVADYRAYSEAPVHLAIRDDFTAHTARVAFLDVEP